MLKCIQITKHQKEIEVLSKKFLFLYSGTQNSPITIVPLHVPEPQVAAPPAQLVYNNGLLLTAVQVYTIFWGTAWQQSPASSIVMNIR
jgi:hypothetical protein